MRMMVDDMKELSLDDVLELLELGKIGHGVAMEWLAIDSLNELTSIMQANGRTMPGHRPMDVAPETTEILGRVTRDIAYAVEAPMNELKHLSDEQIGFLLIGGRIANELNILIRSSKAHAHRSVPGSISADLTTKAERDAQTYLWLMDIIALSGRVHEGLAAVDHFSTLWKRGSNLSEEVLEARTKLQVIKRANRKTIKTVRNRLAMHHDIRLNAQEIKAFRSDTAGGKSLQLLLGRENANTLYLFAIANPVFALLDDLFPGQERQSQMDAFVHVITSTANALKEFVDHAIADILGPTGAIRRDTMALLEMDGRPHIDDLRQPFLTRISGD